LPFAVRHSHHRLGDVVRFALQRIVYRTDLQLWLNAKPCII
jgi:hypothetical protein